MITQNKIEISDVSRYNKRYFECERVDTHMKSMMRAIAAALTAMMLLAALTCGAAAELAQRVDTPTYKVGFYASPCYHIQDADGKRYGYEMMQSIVKHMQATLEFVDYDVSFSDSFALLRQGQIDILTGVKHTDDRDAEFAFSVHPAIR